MQVILVRASGGVPNGGRAVTGGVLITSPTEMPRFQ